jgi:leukotriene-A4 hydrolase
MENKRMEGYATLTLHVEKQTETLTLDTRGLEIVSVEALTEHSTAEPLMKLKFSLGETHPVLGQGLSIVLGSESIPPKIGVHFRVGPGSTAVQFLTPEQTVGKQYPYLFTQCQVCFT